MGPSICELERALTWSPKVRQQMMLQVRKENSFWMATGTPAWARMRCGESMN